MSKSNEELFAAMGADIMSLNKETSRVGVPELYSKVAENYDRAMTAINYNDPYIIASVVQKLQLNPQETKICDFGCGQGIMGRELRKQGFEQMDGIDATQVFCDIVLKDKVYQNAYCTWVGSQDGSFPQSLHNQYDLIVSSGCFIKDHFPKYVFDDFYAAAKPNGIVVFAMRDDHFDEDICEMGYGDYMKSLEADGKFEALSRTSYDKNPGSDDERTFDPYYKPVKASVHVYRVHKTQ